MTFYLSTSALEEIGSGFAGVRGDVLELSLQAEQEFPAFVSGLKEVSKTLSRGILDMVSALSYRQNDLGSLKQRALQSGADPASVDALFSNPEFTTDLERSLSALNSAEKKGWRHKEGRKPDQQIRYEGRTIVITLDGRMTDGEKFLYGLGKIRNVLSTLPPEQVQAASIVLQTAIGGPFGAVKGYLVSSAKDWAFGGIIEKATASTTVSIHNALTGKEWDEEYSWEGKDVTQSGARLTAELLIAGVGSGGAGGVAKGLGKGSPSPAAKGPTGVKEPAVAGNTGRGAGTNNVVSTRAGSAADAARLRMQFSAEQAAGVRMPDGISGYTKHGLNQAISRDGTGVSGESIIKTWNNPLKIEYIPTKKGASFRITGQRSVIVVNANGQIITTWARNLSGRRGK